MLPDLRGRLPQTLRVLLGDHNRYPHRLGSGDQGGRGLRHPLEVGDRPAEALLDVDDHERGAVGLELGAHEATPRAKLRWRNATRPAATVITTRPVSSRPPKQLL